MPTQKVKEEPKFPKVEFHPNDIVLNKYRILNRLGSGGMSSIVYKAEDVNIKNDEFFANKEKNVAIKVVNRDETWKEGEWTKIHDECVTSQRVANKKNIVNTYEVAKINNGNSIIIVMEYIDGISLHDHLAKVDYFSVREATYYFARILDGIKELHSFNEKIIHRDLKPENIMLTKDLMQVKIIDFGISSVMIDSTLSGEKKIVTNEETIFGTYPYISPDLKKMFKKTPVEREKLISVQFDFFPLGVIFYEMLMGEKPFKTADENDISVIGLPLKYDMMCISDINPNIPTTLENIIFRCLASKDSDLKYRYQSVNEIINDLNNYNKDPQKGAFAKLLKPKNERTLQLYNAFNVIQQKQHEKFYEQHWFYWIMFTIASVTLSLIVILACLHELK